MKVIIYLNIKGNDTVSEFTAEQYTVILKAIKENKFLSGNYRIYGFESMKMFDKLIEELLEAKFIDYKNSQVKTKDGRIGFHDKEFKITDLGRDVLNQID